ncbi:signal peptidase I [Bacillus oleivorans]|uniref:Signal peptidase I n=1 Tax=Bacillus oleivorans TaxID=1448271 RepID=A0A285D7S9_9BACI|nr:S26 family signal peptidase [Bacillus oleivorans]SNX75416.1 signal peptidase I [Bacillus oleivorans]
MKKIVFVITLSFFLVGCSEISSSEPLTYNETSREVTTIEHLDSKMFTHHYMYDNMDRGNHDYFNKTLVVDPNYKEVSRGDVVLFEKDNGERSLSRIVALPEETIAIQKGQIYINNKKLDTFYGFAHRAGLDKKAYVELMENETNQKSVKEVFNYSMKNLTLSNEEYYLVSDDWFRGEMLVVRKDKIIGQVMGYKK